MKSKVTLLFVMAILISFLCDFKIVAPKSNFVCFAFHQGKYAQQEFEGFTRIPPSTWAQHKFDDLCKFANVNSKSIRFFCSPNLSNCAAGVRNGKYEILYGPDYLNELDAEAGGWGGFSVLAHELGHVVEGMSDSPYYDEQKADEFSGYLMGLKGATLKEARRAMELKGGAKDDAHADKIDRLEYIRRGWLKGSYEKNTDNKYYVGSADR
jgi:hypothetical protein